MSKEFLFEILKVVVIALVIVVPIRYFLFQPFIVRGVSMEPSFEEGDYLIVDQISYRFNDPQRGESVIFRYPDNPSRRYIKRIIGLPGEEIEVKSGKVFVDGEVLEEDYTSVPVTVGDLSIDLDKKEYFVLGDNRMHSYDSRSWGILPEDNIVGKAIFRVSFFSNFGAVQNPIY